MCLVSNEKCIHRRICICFCFFLFVFVFVILLNLLILRFWFSSFFVVIHLLLFYAKSLSSRRGDSGRFSGEEKDLEQEQGVLVELCTLQLFINLFKLNYKLSLLLCVCVFLSDFCCTIYQIVHFSICQDVR